MSIADRPADDLSVIARFMGYLLVSDTHSWRGEPCMFWQGGKSRGGDRWSEFAFYGTFNPGGCVKGGIRAHVFAAWLAGLIETLRVPEDMNLDHRCHQSLCCNPLHLEVVPKLVNQMRKRNRKEPPVTEEDRDNTPMVRDPTLVARRWIINGDTIYVPLEMTPGDPELESVAKLLEEASIELFGGPRRSASYKLEADHMEMLEMRNLPVEMPDTKPKRQFDNSAPRSPKQTRKAHGRGRQQRAHRGK